MSKYLLYIMLFIILIIVISITPYNENCTVVYDNFITNNINNWTSPETELASLSTTLVDLQNCKNQIKEIQNKIDSDNKHNIELKQLNDTKKEIEDLKQTTEHDNYIAQIETAKNNAISSNKQYQDKLLDITKQNNTLISDKLILSQKVDSLNNQLLTCSKTTPV